MRKIKLAAVLLLISAVVDIILPSFAAGSAADDLALMTTAKDKAISYESGGNDYLAWTELCRYSELAETLEKSGAVSKAEADLAKGWQSSLAFTPEVYLGEESDGGVFFGGDGVFAKGSSAVKLNVPFGVEVADFYHLIPSTADELFVLISMDVSNEYTLRQIAFGKKDDYLALCLRQASRIEGRVYLSFCPSINTWRYTFTLSESFKNAFRHVSELSARYAPGVEVIFTLGDVRFPGRNTVGEFYPGDEYIDAVGVELSHTYSRSYSPSAEAAYDSRGEYYDPIVSVKNMVAEVEDVSSKALPLVITGCSFPWEGDAALVDWAEEMDRFYRLAPAAFPNLEAVLYSNASSSKGITNLRQNADALQLYEACLGYPWYRNYGAESTKVPKPIGNISRVNLGDVTATAFYCGGKYNGAEYTVFLDSKEIGTDGITFTEGKHSLVFYITDEICISRLAYDITVSADGTFSSKYTAAEHDFNGNGLMDFGDIELLSGHIAKWKVDLGGLDTDINGDGRTNLLDLAALRVKISPPSSQ